MQLHLDGNRDLQIGDDGQLKLTTDYIDTVKQRVECRLRTYRGELFMDRGLGVPYFEQFQSKAPDVGSVAMLLRSVVAEVNGVASVDIMDVSFDREHRVFNISMTIRSDTGEVVEINI